MGRQESNSVSKIGKRNKEKSKSLNETRPKESNKTCKYCGKTHPMQKDLCPAYGKFCSKCGKPNHFYTVCMSSEETRRQRWNQSSDSRRDVKGATNESETDESGIDDDRDTHFIDETVRHLTVGKIKVNKVRDFEKTVPIVINDVIVRMEPDSGADVNVMDEYHYKALKRKSYEKIALHDSSTRLSMLQNELHVFGEFKSTARNETRGTDTTFVVVKGKINSPPLLGRRTLIELGMFEITPDGNLKESNELRRTDSKAVKSILDNKVKSDIETILQQHEEVFKGIGKIFDTKNNKDFFVKFSMKAEATPVAQKPLPVLYYLQEALRRWLDECVKEEIFEKVEPGEPVTWCSPLVVQPKPRYSKVSKESLEPHMIRASVDLRVPNKHM